MLLRYFWVSGSASCVVAAKPQLPKEPIAESLWRSARIFCVAEVGTAEVSVGL